MTRNDTVRHLTKGGIALAQRPLAVVAYAAGVVKGTVESTVHVTESVVGSLIHPQRAPHSTETTPAPTETAEASVDTAPASATTAAPEAADAPDSPPAPPAPSGERTMFGGLNTEPAPPMMPGGGGEPIEHEPHAESRAADHGGAVDMREMESWQEEALEEAEDQDPVGATETLGDAQPVGGPGDAPVDGPVDEPLIDPSVAKAIRSETGTLQRASDVEKG